MHKYHAVPVWGVWRQCCRIVYKTQTLYAQSGLGNRWGGGIHGDDVFSRIVSLENLFLAWREFRKGKRAKHDVQQFEFAPEDNIFQLHDELGSRAYRHDVYVPFSINDPKPRRIHKATVRDRLLHHAIFRVLYPIFDRCFIFDSYSCRIKKGTHRAVRRLQVFACKASANNSRNFFALVRDTLGLPTKNAKLVGAESFDAGMDPVYSVATGLVVWGFDREVGGGMRPTSSSQVSGLLKSARQWLKNFLP